jgi:ubiquitin-protein ligase
MSVRPRLGAAKFRTPRTLRLDREWEEMKRLLKDSSILEIETKGDPPDEYRLVLKGRSLAPGKEGVHAVGRQEVELKLGIDYPRQPPRIHWLTPVVHPNISGGSVCLGNFLAYWTPNFTLAQVAEVLWDYSRLAVLNPYHSYQGHDAPVLFAELDRRFGFPVDKRPLRDKVLPPEAGSSVVREAPSDENDILVIEDDGGVCGGGP